MQGILSLRPLWVLMATVFVDMVGFAMVLPLLPFYAKDFGASPTDIGFLVAAYSVAQLLSAPLWGRMSDRYGRRPLIIAGLIAAGCAYVVFGLAQSLWMLFLCRLIQGAGGGTTGVVQAYVADLVPPQDRARALGWITAATSAGVMLGPAIGSLAIHWSHAAPGFLAALLCAANVISARRWLTEPPVPTRPKRPKGSSRQMFYSVLRHPTAPFALPIWIYALGMMAFMAMNAILALFLSDRFGVTAKSIGWFYAYVGGISIVMRAILLGPAVRRFGEGGVVRLGIASLAIGLLSIPLTTSVWILGLAVLFIPVGTALLFPATSSMVSALAPKDSTGQALGVQQSFGGVARLVGPIWAGSLFEIGYRVPFWTGAGLMALLLVPSLSLSRRIERSALLPIPATPAESTTPSS
jgi:multidrug resistance protein